MASKIISVIGGSGYLGLNILKEASKLKNITLYSVSRSGKPADMTVSDKINWVKGDALQPNKFEDILKESDIIIHTVGTLIDTSVTKFAKPGENGTYEQLNFESAKHIGDKLNELSDPARKKKIIYISASRAPPLLERYITTKRKAEEHISKLPNLTYTILRPGYIISVKERPITLPIKMASDIQQFMMNLVPNTFFLKDCLKTFQLDGYVEMEDLCKTCLVAGLMDGYENRIIENEEIARIGGSVKYD